ncbi:hypothetical protein SOMG_02334 [Schizosaccharomyces osmophilus]|uniref:Uncharacterized protein n=1 Tax=Schizosaccharomyces osmophilus TaxID=2545709 RepID=A0AAE9W6R0_9SCHI|nr:uncharacterized protein SOMG_02334 [Schizosaccharomyces osmophilus]WBW71006.1 hypothetical protein SOMG_02334 [Schizosaccharomyces osmophilus]
MRTVANAFYEYRGSLKDASREQTIQLSYCRPKHARFLAHLESDSSGVEQTANELHSLIHWLPYILS